MANALIVLGVILIITGVLLPYYKIPQQLASQGPRVQYDPYTVSTYIVPPIDQGRPINLNLPQRPTRHNYNTPCTIRLCRSEHRFARSLARHLRVDSKGTCVLRISTQIGSLPADDYKLQRQFLPIHIGLRLVSLLPIQKRNGFRHFCAVGRYRVSLLS